ncbi:MAG: NADH:ubiquinone reductase (Na(+)-transporting) subunit D [Saprospiraceae bacterium]|nr:NADH:ubiquinone reductase (Na(+)-transporting) subunit D [Saprospiraceae bacterium]MBK8635498.1 NADH:ubiquinone reductase (Na(+)-transporting) subunit D [Saprospiraceae bacterium]HMS69177.1 NADH:ubiquinone reductase (Na(+)-transporting) subunit D [Saprospiraceae bacterium]
MAEILEKKAPAIEFGKEERKLLTDPLNSNNPITVQILGVCSALAVTTLMNKALVMAIAVTVVTAMSNAVTSMLRNSIPKQVRMIVQLIIAATLVTIVELTLKAVNYPIYKELSVFIGLIITNCIVMGRLEAYAMANRPWRSFLDGIGNGLGYGIILIVVAFFRELLGKGSVFGFLVIGNTSDYLINTTSSPWLSWYANNNLMVLFPSAMFVIGIVIWAHRAWNKSLVDIS